MGRTVILKWTFEPPDFFEEGIDLRHEECTLHIGEGEAEAQIPFEVFEKLPERRRELHDMLANRLAAVQALTHMPYKLSDSSRTDIDENGKKHHFVEVPTVTFKVSVGQVDFQHKDKDGNIIFDSKKVRIDKKRAFANSIMSLVPHSPVLASLLRSYDAAVRDPANELIHLYEIRDALSAHYGGERKTCAALGISNSKWDKLGRLCNVDPLKQGRHRGQKLAGLRDATKAELEEARAIAIELIEKYVSTLH